MKQDLPVRVETVGHVPERFTKRIQKQRRWGIAVRRLSNSSTETHISGEKRDHRKYGTADLYWSLVIYGLACRIFAQILLAYASVMFYHLLRQNTRALLFIKQIISYIR